MSLYEHVQHPRIARRKETGPVKVAAQLPHEGSPLTRFNTWLALKITGSVGTMWCAYVFAGIAAVTLPNAIRGGTTTLIPWIAQTFLQLVLLSVIMVGQNVQALAADKRAEATYEDADAVLHTALQIEQHLQAQDAALEVLADKLGAKLELAGHAK
jgi:hypothetical protein